MNIEEAAAALHVAQDVCAPVAHRQVVLTIPKRLRLHTRGESEPAGKLSHCAWTCILAEARRLLGRRRAPTGHTSAAWVGVGRLRDGARVVPGMVAAIGDSRRAAALASSFASAFDLRRVYPRGRFCGTSRTRFGSSRSRLAGPGAPGCPVAGRGQDSTGSGREHADLGAQWVQRRSVAAVTRGRPSGYRVPARRESST